MYDRYYNKGTYNFEKRYNPNEQKFDLEKIRKSNINKINDIIKESQNVIDQAINDVINEFSAKKTEAVRKYHEESERLEKEYSKAPKTYSKETSFEEIQKDLQKQKKDYDDAKRDLEKKLDEKLKKLEIEKIERIAKIEIQNKTRKLENDYKIREEIYKQTKMLTVLKSGEHKYQYYKLIFSMPLDDRYKSLEETIYREYLMSHPSIENIIVSFSSMDNDTNNLNNSSDHKNIVDMLKKARKSFDEKTLTDARSLIGALDDSVKEKEELNKESNLIGNLIDTKKSIELAATCLDKKVWNMADTLLKSLPECEEKEMLSNGFDKVANKNKIDFVALSKELSDKLENNDLLDSDKVEELSKRFELLKYNDDIWKDDHKRIIIRDRIKKIIDKNNIQIQEKRKADIAKDDEYVKKNNKSFKTIISEMIAFPVRLIRRTKKYGEYLLGKIQKSKDNGNVEKAAEQTDIYHERDIVNSGTLFINSNKLNKLRFKLFKEGLSDDNQEKRLINGANKVVSSVDKNLSSMINKEMDEIYADEKRTICIIKQYMENLSIIECDENELKAYAKKVKEFIENSKLDELTKKAYCEEIYNICLYKQSNEKQYVYTDDDIENIKINDSELPYVKKM